ncbi:MAG TPA: hypothetical protein VMY37_30920 [Thermoguttaceae bacterium]|nr:hypothetical protein [Thermoguttaceae bacterium]
MKKLMAVSLMVVMSGILCAGCGKEAPPPSKEKPAATKPAGEAGSATKAQEELGSGTKAKEEAKTGAPAATGSGKR